MKMFDEQAEKNIIEDDADHHQHKIAEQLDATVQNRVIEYDIPVEEVSRWKAHQKGNDKGRDNGPEGNKTQVQYLLVQDKIIRHGINNDIQQGIGGTAGGIPEGPHRHQLSEWRIKKIYKGNDLFFGHPDSVFGGQS